MDNTEYEKYTDYIIDKTVQLLAVDSPSGYTDEAAQLVYGEFAKLGYSPSMTKKGGIIVCLGGKDKSDAVLVDAHVDTLGGMVTEILDNGHLRINEVGGLEPENCEGENVRVVTKSKGVYEGTFELENPSIHVNREYRDIKRVFANMEVVLDENVSTREQVQALGIRPGDFVCFDPRTKLTKTGFIKSRYLDDKLAVGIVLGYAKYLKDKNVTPDREVWVHITVYEEVVHGGCASVPENAGEVLAIDMGCVGGRLCGDEHKASICAKDNHSPYSYSVIQGLIKAAEDTGADYVVDVFPNYGSDADDMLKAGWDLKHGLIGPGVYASHGYERSHRNGTMNVLKILVGYLG